VGPGEGVSPQWGGGCAPSLGRGLCPLPRKFFDFLSGNGAFWVLVLMLV